MTARVHPITRQVVAGIYCRISQDRLDRQLGVKRQEKAARKLCERNGWTVGEVYVDDDISAYSGKVRPAYQRMLTAIANGTITAVAAYDLDRLHRLPIELEHFFNVCDGAGLTDMGTAEGDIDLGTSDGRMMARIMGAVAKKASDDTSRRQRAKMDELAEAGMPHGGPPSFGYLDPMTIDPAMKIVFDTMVAAVLTGETATGVARVLNATGVRTVRSGGLWTAQQVTRTLVSPRQAGLRVHRGEVVGPAKWPALISVETHERLKARLAPAEANRTPRHRVLWTGLLRCTECGNTLTRSHHRNVAVWTCRRFVGRVGGGCGCSIEIGPLEEVLHDLLIARLRHTTTPEIPDDSGAGLIAALEAEATEWGIDAGAGRCTKATAMAAIRGINERIAAARIEAFKALRAAALIDFAMLPGEAEAKFDAMPLSAQRALVTAVLTAVWVTPGPTRQVDGRLKVDWIDHDD